jgi:hypothetical protein
MKTTPRIAYVLAGCGVFHERSFTLSDEKRFLYVQEFSRKKLIFVRAGSFGLVEARVR